MLGDALGKPGLRVDDSSGDIAEVVTSSLGIVIDGDPFEPELKLGFV